MRQWPQVQALLCPQSADDALTTKPEPESSLIGERHDRRHEGCRPSTDLSIRQIQSKIAGRASRGIVGEITKDLPRSNRIGVTPTTHE